MKNSIMDELRLPLFDAIQAAGDVFTQNTSPTQGASDFNNLGDSTRRGKPEKYKSKREVKIKMAMFKIDEILGRTVEPSSKEPSSSELDGWATVTGFRTDRDFARAMCRQIQTLGQEIFDEKDPNMIARRFGSLMQMAGDYLLMYGTGEPGLEIKFATCGFCGNNTIWDMDLHLKTCSAVKLAEGPIESVEQVKIAKVRSCNMHQDCDAANARAAEKGRSFVDHCHDDDCEDCFGK